MDMMLILHVVLTHNAELSLMLLLNDKIQFVSNEKRDLFWAVVNPLTLPSEESEGTICIALSLTPKTYSQVPPCRINLYFSCPHFA